MTKKILNLFICILLIIPFYTSKAEQNQNGLPDLIIKDILITPGLNDLNPVVLNISNDTYIPALHKNDTPTIWVKIIDLYSGKEWKTGTDIRSEDPFKIIDMPDTRTIDNGKYKFQATVDYENLIEESNEDNNVFIKEVIIDRKDDPHSPIQFEDIYIDTISEKNIHFKFKTNTPLKYIQQNCRAINEEKYKMNGGTFINGSSCYNCLKDDGYYDVHFFNYFIPNTDYKCQFYITSGCDENHPTYKKLAQEINIYADYFIVNPCEYGGVYSPVFFFKTLASGSEKQEKVINNDKPNLLIRDAVFEPVMRENSIYNGKLKIKIINNGGIATNYQEGIKINFDIKDKTGKIILGDFQYIENLNINEEQIILFDINNLKTEEDILILNIQASNTGNETIAYIDNINENDNFSQTIDLEIQNTFYQFQNTQIAKNLLNIFKPGGLIMRADKNGEVYYLPTNLTKAIYLANGTSALSLMRSQGYGINAQFTAFLEEDENNETLEGKKFRTKWQGYILLVVEGENALGQAYYINPHTNFATYLKNGNSAYEIMRNQSKGISEDNWNKLIE